MELRLLMVLVLCY